MNEVTQEKQKIMYIATHTPNKSIAEELREIKTVIRGINSGLELDDGYVNSVGEISELIQNTKPVPLIIHISGEAVTDGTLLIPNSDDDRKTDRVKAEELAEFFSNATDVNCVILNFCYSSQATRLIAQHIQCVIGVEGDIPPKAAVEFSKNFYRSLEGKILNQGGIDEAFSKGQDGAWPRMKDSKYIKLTKSKPQPEMQIIEPAEGSKVPYPCECRGTFKNLDEGASMWAYVKATMEGKFYLVLIGDYPTGSTDGEWQVSLKIGPEQADNDNYRIGVLMVDRETTPGLRSQYDKSIQEREFFALDSLPAEGTQAFGERRVKRQ